MNIKELTEQDIFFSEVSLMDDVGRVFFYENRVFRAIYNQESVGTYKKILNERWINDLFEKGLVKTWICNDIKISGVPLILEHEKISFITIPCEWTAKMFWNAIKAMIEINLELSKYGFLLKDSHPYNIVYHFGKPVFIDFGSIIQSKEIPTGWMEQFIEYIGVPLWLGITRWSDLSIEYKKEHANGFGILLFKKKIMRLFFLRKLIRFSKYFNNPKFFFKKILTWIENHNPKLPLKETWADYEQFHTMNNSLPLMIKKQFVLDVLREEKPNSVIDCAANKGYYAKIAAEMQIPVLAFDCEEFCVDKCLKIAQDNHLNLTPVMMNFRKPTPSFGDGLVVGNAFVRFRADIVLVLGIIHHLCLKEKLPVRVFCQICLNYAKKGVILEFVGLKDKHVKNWKMKQPLGDYTLEKIIYFFSEKFPNYRIVSNNMDGLDRKLVYFF